MTLKVSLSLLACPLPQKIIDNTHNLDKVKNIRKKRFSVCFLYSKTTSMDTVLKKYYAFQSIGLTFTHTVLNKISNLQ